MLQQIPASTGLWYVMALKRSFPISKGFVLKSDAQAVLDLYTAATNPVVGR